MFIAETNEPRHFLHDYIYKIMQNAIHSFEVRAISNSGVSRHPTETGDRIHYMTFSIIHYK